MIRFDTKKDMEHYDNLYHKIIELEQENKQLKEKIDKAIEYIKEHKDENNYVFLLPSELQVILSILGDKENEWSTKTLWRIIN